MRILVLLHDSFGGIGGIAKFNRDLLSALALHPACREVVALPRMAAQDAERPPAGVRLRRVPPGGKAAYFAAAIAEALRPAPIDLVVSGHLRLLPAAAAAARLRRARLWLTVHGIDAWEPVSRILDPWLLRRTDRVISVSRLTQARVVAWSGLDTDRFRLLPNCVDLEVFTPGPRDPHLAARYGIAADATVIMTLARFAGAERYKGVDEVLEALPDLASHRPGLVYLVVGDGPDRARLEAKAAALGVASRTVFAGRIPEEEKAAHYRLADAFVMPGRGEGFGIVYLEAMACGVPAVGSLVDGSREALRDGALGILVDPGDRAKIVAGILAALDRPKGVPPGLAYFSKPRFIERVHALLDEAMAGRAEPGVKPCR